MVKKTTKKTSRYKNPKDISKTKASKQASKQASMQTRMETDIGTEVAKNNAKEISDRIAKEEKEFQEALGSARAAADKAKAREVDKQVAEAIAKEISERHANEQQQAVEGISAARAAGARAKAEIVEEELKSQVLEIVPTVVSIRGEKSEEEAFKQVAKSRITKHQKLSTQKRQEKIAQARKSKEFIKGVKRRAAKAKEGRDPKLQKMSTELVAVESTPQTQPMEFDFSSEGIASLFERNPELKRTFRAMVEQEEEESKKLRLTTGEDVEDVQEESGVEESKEESGVEESKEEPHVGEGPVPAQAPEFTEARAEGDAHGEEKADEDTFFDAENVDDRVPDAMEMEGESGEPVNAQQTGEQEGDVGQPQAGQDTLEDDAGPGTGDFGADGRDDFLSPDELKTLHQDKFTWRQQNTKYMTRKSRGKIGYGTSADIQRIEPFGVGVKRHPDQDDDILIKQGERGFEPFRGRHVIEKVTAQEKDREMMRGKEEDIEPAANKPFAKIDGKIIWIPFYGKSALYFFKSKDYEELVSNVVEESGELKLKAPDQNAFKNMQNTIDGVRTSLQNFGLMQKRIRHESLITRHAEWLELKQMMKAIADYEATTSGEYNTAGLFSGNLRDAVTKALNDTVSKMDSKSFGRMKRGLDASQIDVQAKSSSSDLKSGEMNSMNPFMLEESSLQVINETLPRFF